MLISLKKKFVLGPCGRICFFVEHVTHEELYSWVCGIWSISKRWLVVIQVLKSLILTAKLLKSSFFFFFFLLIQGSLLLYVEICPKFTSNNLPISKYLYNSNIFFNSYLWTTHISRGDILAGILTLDVTHTHFNIVSVYRTEIHY